jgi:hypothetical protein
VTVRPDRSDPWLAVALLAGLALVGLGVAVCMTAWRAR